MRRFWIENRAGDIWDLNSNDLAEPDKAFLANPEGLGIRTRIRSFEIENTTFIEDIQTQTEVIQGTIHFADYEHFGKFAEFLGVINDDEPLKLYYSTQKDGDRHWYKRILVTEIRKGEINTRTSTLEVRVRFECLSRWRQDHHITLDILRVGTAHVHPYLYPFTYAGNSLAVEIDNTGNLWTSCVITVEGQTDTPTFRLIQNNEIIDQARYNIIVPTGARLVVDSAPDTQMAELRRADDTIENVYYAGEPDYTFSNFIMIPTGKSTFVASAHNSNMGRFSISFSIQREVI